jgi:hypothetical protein
VSGQLAPPIKLVGHKEYYHTGQDKGHNHQRRRVTVTV